jgi:uncharacterized protein YcgL (UPF0745 family)
MFCQVYRSPRRQEAYLYVEKSEGLERVPAALLQQFGEPESIMLVHLDGKRRLARADAEEVLQKIQEQGYYLQMPPGPADLKRKRD